MATILFTVYDGRSNTYALDTRTGKEKRISQDAFQLCICDETCDLFTNKGAISLSGERRRVRCLEASDRDGKRPAVREGRFARSM
jgi:hypothetical protein